MAGRPPECGALRAAEQPGDHPMADPEVLRWWLADAGARIGTDAAVGVEVITF